MGFADFGQARQFLHVAVAHFNACKMGFPDHFGIARLLEFPGQEGQGPVPAPGVDAHHFDPLLQKEKGALPVHPRPLDQVLLSAPGPVGPGLNQHDVQGFEFVADALQLPFHLGHGDPLAVPLVPEIEDHAVAEAPGQRDLVNGPGPLPLVHGGMIVKGRIQVRARVGGEGEKLHGPSQTGRKLVFGDSREKLHHLLGAHFMGDVVDLGNHHGRVARESRLDGDAQINESFAGHSHTLPFFFRFRACPERFPIPSTKMRAQSRLSSSMVTKSIRFITFLYRARLNTMAW